MKYSHTKITTTITTVKNGEKVTTTTETTTDGAPGEISIQDDLAKELGEVFDQIGDLFDGMGKTFEKLGKLGKK